MTQASQLLHETECQEANKVPKGKAEWACIQPSSCTLCERCMDATCYPATDRPHSHAKEVRHLCSEPPLQVHGAGQRPSLGDDPRGQAHTVIILPVGWCLGKGAYVQLVSGHVF